MPARIAINGRVYGTRWFKPSVRTAAVDPIGQPLYPPPPILTAPPRPVTGRPWKDPDTGVVYRVLPALDARECVPATTVMAWYGVGHAAVLEWARVGLLDAVRTAASPTLRYRVLDAAVLRVAAAQRTEQTQQTKRRGRWKRMP